MKKFLNWLLGLLDKISKARLYCVFAGVIVALFFMLVLKMYLCFWPAIFIGAGLEFARSWSNESDFDYLNVIALVIGSLIVQAFVWICITPNVPFALTL